jgi:hypothetical protein
LAPHSVARTHDIDPTGENPDYKHYPSTRVISMPYFA